jgi:hypothetical protein
MMALKKALAIGMLVVAAVGIVILLTSVPAKRRLTITLEGTVPATIEHAKALVDSRVARFLDPEGHDLVARALAIEARIAAGGSRELDEIGLHDDVTMATDRHQIVAHRARLLGIAGLAMIFVGGLIGFVLWRLDRRSGLWIGVSSLLTLAVVPIGLTYRSSTGLSVGLLALWLVALATVGHQATVAMRLRRPEEIP